MAEGQTPERGAHFLAAVGDWADQRLAAVTGPTKLAVIVPMLAGPALL